MIGTNVAILVYARTATRTGEIAVRTALGASRGRIVMQLFGEALVLSAMAAAVGIAVAQLALVQLNALVDQIGGEQIPFWMHFGISPGVILYVAGLTVLAAVIVGLFPALKATRRRVTANLQQLSAGGGSGMRLGRTWTVLIVAQVAIAVAILPATINGLARWVARGMTKPAFATDEFLAASLRLDREGVGTDDSDAYEGVVAARYASLEAELVRRLEAEPGVSDVVLSSAAPGQEPQVRIEVDGAPAVNARSSKADSATESVAGQSVGVSQIEADFFDVFDVPILAGRAFQPADATGDASAQTAVIVNRSFVQTVLGGGDPLGRRVRPAVKNGSASSESVRAPWSEIVGVVPDFPPSLDSKTFVPKMYRPMVPGAVHPVTLAVHVRGADATTFASRLRDISVAVDPMLRLSGVRRLDGPGDDLEKGDGSIHPRRGGPADGERRTALVRRHLRAHVVHDHPPAPRDRDPFSVRRRATSRSSEHPGAGRLADRHRDRDRPGGRWAHAARRRWRDRRDRWARRRAARHGGRAHGGRRADGHVRPGPACAPHSADRGVEGGVTT